MMDYIEKLRAKPGHIRQRIAFGTAAGASAVVALGWLAVVTSTNLFMPAPAPNGATEQLSSAFEATKSSFSNFFSGSQNTPAGITVETQASTTVGQGSPTAIPF